MGREVLRLLLLAAASWPCSSFFAPATLGGAARGVALLSPRHAAPQRAGRRFALLVSASGAPILWNSRYLDEHEPEPRDKNA